MTISRVILTAESSAVDYWFDALSSEWSLSKKMQLDVEVSPPASVIHLIYCNWWMAINCLRMDPNVNGSWDLNYCPVNFGPVSFGPVTDRQKAMHKSPPCISTGVLNNNEQTKSTCSCRPTDGRWYVILLALCEVLCPDKYLLTMWFPTNGVRFHFGSQVDIVSLLVACWTSMLGAKVRIPLWSVYTVIPLVKVWTLTCNWIALRVDLYYMYSIGAHLRAAAKVVFIARWSLYQGSKSRSSNSTGRII